MSMDDVVCKWNTPERRAEIVNAPEPFQGFTFASYPRDVPHDFSTYAATTASSNMRRSVILHGTQGSGKTGLGVCALQMFARQRVGSLFQWNVLTAERATPVEKDEQVFPAPCWFERWSAILARNRRADWDEVGWFDALDDVTVLMLDDIGSETGTEFRQSLMLRHLEWAEDKKERMLILTLNTAPPQWEKVLGERVADRLLEQRRFLTVRVPGGSLR